MPLFCFFSRLCFEDIVVESWSPIFLFLFIVSRRCYPVVAEKSMAFCAPPMSTISVFKSITFLLFSWRVACYLMATLSCATLYSFFIALLLLVLSSSTFFLFMRFQVGLPPVWTVFLNSGVAFMRGNLLAASVSGGVESLGSSCKFSKNVCRAHLLCCKRVLVPRWIFEMP